MIPGSIEFRKHLSRLLPQKGGEAKANYLARLARHFDISHSRMTVLYYDQRKDNARFTPDEYLRLFPRISPQSEAKTKRTTDVIKRQKAIDEKMLHAYRELCSALEERITLGA